MFVGLICKSHPLKQLDCFFVCFLVVAVKDFELRKFHILNNCNVGEQFKILEHHSNARAQLRQICFLGAD